MVSEREKIEAPDRRSVTDEGEDVKEIWMHTDPEKLLEEFRENVGGWEFAEEALTCRVQGKSIGEWVDIVRAQIASSGGNALVHPFKQTQFNGYPGVSVGEWRRPYRDLLLRAVQEVVAEVGFVEKTVIFAMLVTGRAWSWKTLTNYVLRRAGEYVTDLMESTCALTSGRNGLWVGTVDGSRLEGTPIEGVVRGGQKEEVERDGPVLAAVTKVGGVRREVVDTSRSDPGEEQTGSVGPADAMAALNDPEGDDEQVADLEGLAYLQQVEQNAQGRSEVGPSLGSELEDEDEDEQPPVSDAGGGEGEAT